MELSEARRRFAALVSQPQGAFRLAEGALLIAQEEYPELSVASCLARIDAMAETLKTELGFELDPQRLVARINVYLFDEQQFRGNVANYYDPRNSFLNEVLERRLGIPITLSVLYIEVGRQIGLPIVGIGMPGHFLIQYTAQPEPFWLDPFHRGQVLQHEDCQARLQEIYGQQLSWQDTYLQPISDHAILWRMLNNLKSIYIRQGDYRRALWVIDRILLLHPERPTEVRDRGLVHAQLGHLQDALDDLQRYLELFQEAPDVSMITRYITALRRQLES
jgi:regulator of sirC expression with transglutaminase-like and TPR domain